MASTAATLKDVAHAAGVAVSTASRALAGNPVVSQETSDRVRQCAEQLNYRPNAQARALRSSRSNIIGVTIPSLVNPYFAEMAAVIQEEANRAGISTIISSTSEDAERLIDSLHILSDQRVDGIIAVPYNGTEDSLAALDATGMPLVLVDRELPGNKHLSVASDSSAGLSSAVAHLLEKGNRRIGYLSGPMTTSTGVTRLEEFTAACHHFQLPEQPIYQGGYHREDGYRGTEWLLSQNVDAIIAGDSMMTVGALEACHKKGIAIGHDVALIGFDDQPIMRLQACPITVIDQQVATMGRLAFSLLHNLITDEGGSGKSPPSSIRTPTTLIIRASSDFDRSSTTDKEVRP
ncbi:HTH-type transcriptional repressor PurR [Corynebacterium atrinae]|uniref:LacI family DNA-binding transcriptional regulator n=1 Tax=Corynebacterium atrinae TaxID=1336740 RepID=UPI0025B56192|nr:LacI family DNA-binding transcriptional regulator [Corynebacterium atrinae]WJY63964.1 HTH-type transcriptional repressor PurR [Corynebacterium atrinae]